MSNVRGISAAQWQELYQRLEKRLYNVAWRYVWNAQEAEDIVHDAFLQIWERRERMQFETTDRYLWVSVMNLARKRRRWMRAKRFLQIEDATDDLQSADCIEADAAQREQALLLRTEIERLPEALRSVLLLAEFSEMRYEDIAQLLSIPLGTVASRRHLAMKKLRERHRSNEP
jgi:RNA polymerase sigma-70 factor (ECF subfamily)